MPMISGNSSTQSPKYIGSDLGKKTNIYQVIQASNMLGVLCAFTFPNKSPMRKIFYLFSDKVTEVLNG